MKKLKLNLDDLHVESFKVTPDKPGTSKGTVEGYSYDCTFDDTCRPRLCPTEFRCPTNVNCPTQHTDCDQNTCDPWCTEHTHCGQFTCAAGCTVFTNCGTCNFTCEDTCPPIECITIP